MRWSIDSICFQWKWCDWYCKQTENDQDHRDRTIGIYASHGRIKMLNYFKEYHWISNELLLLLSSRLWLEVEQSNGLISEARASSTYLSCCVAVILLARNKSNNVGGRRWMQQQWNESGMKERNPVYFRVSFSIIWYLSSVRSWFYQLSRIPTLLY